MKKIFFTLSFFFLACIAVQAQDMDSNSSAKNEALKAKNLEIVKQKRQELQQRQNSANKINNKSTPASNINTDGNARKTTETQKSGSTKAITRELLEKQAAEKKKKTDQ